MRTLLLIAASTTLLWPSDCSRNSIGFEPLNTPAAPSYKGSRLGLYPNGSNTRPAAFEARGRAQAAQVRPRDAAGAIDDAAGRIVLLSIGMSNTTQEFSAFQQLAARDKTINPRVVLVDGAQGGWTAARILSDSATYFATVDQRMAASHVASPQVQAAWIKLADARPTAPFPDHVNILLNETRQILGLLRARYPNLRLVYLSSRIYAGYASTPLNPEPFAYETAFAVKWLVEQQINGDAGLPAVPWLAWGPYLWSDGTRTRHDGLAWACSDFANDGTHPGNEGRAKVAQMLLDFFKTDTTTRSWFVTGSPAAQRP
ncbi:MAG: hypothetical protein ACRD8O_15880 [Bryobacteraceae bacterium]